MREWRYSSTFLFFTPALEGGELSASRPLELDVITRWIGGWKHLLNALV
jgi:hypothetical protein